MQSNDGCVFRCPAEGCSETASQVKRMREHMVGDCRNHSEFRALRDKYEIKKMVKRTSTSLVPPSAINESLSGTASASTITQPSVNPSPPPTPPVDEPLQPSVDPPQPVTTVPALPATIHMLQGMTMQDFHDMNDHV